jgi:elongation factor G
VEKGVRQILEEGAIAGFPMQDVSVSVYDGKFHPVDSKEIAFITAGKKAFLDAIEKARPVVLEPVVKIEIIAPNASMGDLTGDLSTKRGRISGSEALQNNRVAISGEVPMAELDGYDARLKSLTGGEGTYSIAFSHYDPVPGNIQKQLTDKFERHD